MPIRYHEAPKPAAPPETRGRPKGPWVDVLEVVMEQPGVDFEIAEADSRSEIEKLRRTLTRAGSDVPGEFKFMVRNPKDDDGSYQGHYLFARYLGEAS